jgi:predicted nucleic acid-binding protein
MIVADTGPIIAFARLGRLDLLHQVVEALVIPDAVYEELVGRGHDRPGAAEVVQGGWIHRRTVTDQGAVAQLPRVLHAGEREAIILAHEL